MHPALLKTWSWQLCYDWAEVKVLLLGSTQTRALDCIQLYPYSTSRHWFWRSMQTVLSELAFAYIVAHALPADER